MAAGGGGDQHGSQGQGESQDEEGGAGDDRRPGRDREATWPDIEPHVDEALNELPQELREVLVLYFLEGRTQAEIARHLDRNQATVSRAIERGISAMREALKARGITCGIGFAALFANQSAHAMPAALQASLGKLSLTSIGASSVAIPATTVAGSTLIAMTTTTKALLITGTLATASLPFLLSRPEAKPVAIQPVNETRTPTAATRWKAMSCIAWAPARPSVAGTTTTLPSTAPAASALMRVAMAFGL